MDLSVILLLVMVVLVIALFVVSFLRRRKFNQDLGTLREELKVGDKVMTDSGIVGEVVSSYTEEEYKYIVLKSGDKEHVGYFTVHANAIYYVFGKDDAKKPAEKIVIKAPTPTKVEEEVKEPESKE